MKSLIVTCFSLALSTMSIHAGSILKSGQFDVTTQSNPTVIELKAPLHLLKSSDNSGLTKSIGKPVAEYTLEQEFTKESTPFKLPEDFFNKIKGLRTATIAIELTAKDLQNTDQVIISSSSQSNDEYFGIYLNNTQYGVKFDDAKGKYSANNPKGMTDRHLTLLITMDETNSTNCYYYSFYSEGDSQNWIKSINTGFKIFGNVSHVDGIYLGGVTTQSNEKKHPFIGTIHAVRVWDHILADADNNSISLYRGTLLFESKNDSKPYRIPAMTQASNGNIITVADFRHGGWDLGYGRIDLKTRVYDSGKQKWQDEATVIEGIETHGTLKTAYSDAAIVADQGSNDVLLVAGTGDTKFQEGRKSLNTHIRIARMYSHDNGNSWMKGDKMSRDITDITDDIYNLFKDSPFKPENLFVTSGRIAQSRRYQSTQGTSNRIYTALLVTNEQGDNFNAVIYSDDFGKSWDLLGGNKTMPIPLGAGGDEAKVEELPDGSVLISSRTTGRFFNIFNYTDTETAAGFWSKHAKSSNITATDPTNGDILCVPVVRNEDQKQMYLLLQSLPTNSKRQRMAIYYKPLLDLGNFNLPKNVAAEWENHFVVTDNYAAYSTMEILDNHSIGFLYEDGWNAPYNGITDGSYYKGYNLFYRNLSLEDVTRGKYSYDDSIESSRQEYILSNIGCKYDFLSESGRYVGQTTSNTAANRQLLNQAIQNFKLDNTEDMYLAINQTVREALSQASKIEIVPGHVYRLINMQEGYELAAAQDGGINVQKQDISNINHYFTFREVVNENGRTDYQIQHLNKGNYIGKLKSQGWPSGNFRVQFPQASSSAGIFLIESQSNGVSTLRCINPESYYSNYYYLSPKKTNDNPNNNLIAWEPEENWCNWNIEPVYNSTVKLNGSDGEYWSSLYLPYAISIPEDVEAFIGQENKEKQTVTLIPVTDAPAETGLIIKSKEKKAWLPIVYGQTFSEVSGNMLGGTLTDMTVDKADESNKYYTLGGGSHGIGLYRPKNGNIPANKAFFLINSETNAAFYSFSFGEVTDINEVTTTQEQLKNNQSVIYYDLSGRQVTHPTSGIYIANGRKVYIK